MNIQNKKEFSLPFFGRDLKFILSDIAGQANAAVIGQYGETAVLVTAVMGKENRVMDYFPLTVDYEERFYAAGKVLGSRFIRREGRPSDFAVLSGRLIDRTIRPLFDQRLRRDVQLVVTILSYDEENDPDFVALNTASLALAISDIPWNGLVGGLRILKTKDGFIFNPLNSEKNGALKEEGSFEAFFSGTDKKINMVELEGRDAKEKEAQDAFLKSFKEIKNLISFQEKIVKEVGRAKSEVSFFEVDAKLSQAIGDFSKNKLEKALYVSSKNERNQELSDLKEELVNHLMSLGFESLNGLESVWEDLVNQIVHQNILTSEKRPDGRKLNELRPLEAHIGLFKRLHGSALFIRGETQSLAVTTLAAPGSEQLVETMEVSAKRRFMLHYNFPPYSTGEVGRLGMPGRREIGHGALAEKALRGVIPSQDEFPYTIRVVSEILSSNGSSSMASACAGTLSLMDAGVPIKKPVAGIAMGLITYQGYDPVSTSQEYKILTDIQGPEDHYGDMDLKAAGTRDGLTALQMDVKIGGIDEEIFSKTLVQAKEARLQILDLIEKTIPAPRPQISSYAPIILTIEIKPSQIGSVIGPGGKVINGMIEDFGLESIDIDDSGKVYVSADSLEKAQKAIDFIRGMTREFAVGEVVEGEIIKILDFGAIVDLGGGKDGMIHVSELKNGFVEKVSDVVKLGDRVRAKIIKVEENGKIGLSLKALDK
ncbi:MAG: polynucleotide phosphorylase/polyadenylase, polyribonucleotide nucleotidyltransferase [Candidatus Wolfebacteria bacterium GW2011_GWC1_43_10]|uniref:Polyribonucleotide nucleotidyltransferase n=1 Tax=Candidatus Wolfebacteria bacterium GW2011_GWC1_43_10 TaxID=1619011 RepID=A0A0G1CC96_9BACT|nr:MAG: polynucleotide phosphorylase/polyadenylase, polyribonucleotide nucleotidyltransferase [Candidatus Wolfebacteria bacterium GW2011_GWC1_43_10]